MTCWQRCRPKPPTGHGYAHTEIRPAGTNMRQLDRYLLFGVRQIDGWLHPDTAEFIAAISDVQHRAGYHGAVGEIGVHHGKLFILLRLAADPEEQAFVIDVFDDQALNVDGSGHGDQKILQDNLIRWCGSTAGVSILAKSSLVVIPADILSSCGKVRLASIDGGHTAECAYSDLKLIDAVMHDYGIIALDDYFNEDWPGVSTGTARYLLESGTRFRPFAIAPNKLFLATDEFNDFYRAKLASETPFKAAHSSEMFSRKVDVFHGAHVAPPLGTFVRQTLRASAIGPYLLAAKGLLNQRFGRG